MSRCAVLPSIKTLSDVKNEFLARRELVCDFEDASGRIKRAEAIEAVSKEHGLDGKLVIPVRLQNHVGRTHTTGTFFVYDDETVAKAHIDHSIMERIEKSKAAGKGAADDQGDGKADASGGEEKPEAAESAGKGAADDQGDAKADASGGEEKPEAAESSGKGAADDQGDAKADASGGEEKPKGDGE